MTEFAHHAFWVFAFGGLGSVARYGAGVWIGPRENLWNYPTLLVNLVGALLAGALWSMALQKGWLTETLFVGTLVGFLGGFTTFSAMSLEAVQLVNSGRWGEAIAYLLVSVALGLVACGVGAWAVRAWA